MNTCATCFHSKSRKGEMSKCILYGFLVRNNDCCKCYRERDTASEDRPKKKEETEKDAC